MVKDYNLNVAYQWLLGRLSVLDALITENPCKFIVKKDDVSPSGSSNSCNAMNPVLKKADVEALLQFALKAVGYQHTKVVHLARRVFYQVFQSLLYWEFSFPKYSFKYWGLHVAKYFYHTCNVNFSIFV